MIDALNLGDPDAASQAAKLPADSGMSSRVALLDWTKTPLGAPDSWPQSLKAPVGLLLTSRFSMWMGWGPELTFLYNDSYARDTLGKKHPWALGRPAREVWAEIWNEIGPRIQQVMDTGVATWDEGLLLFLERSGYREETYHTFSYSPLAGDDGAPHGMFCVVMEETERVIAGRRLSTLQGFAAELMATARYEEVLAAVSSSLRDSRDLPFTLTYLFDEDGARARLACMTGIDAGHRAAPDTIDLDNVSAAWPAGAMLANRRHLVMDDLSGRLGELPSGPWKVSPEQAVVVPITQSGQDHAAGFFVAGINPHRRLDAAYVGFVNLIAGQIAASLANASAYEDERHRAEALRELDQAKTTFFSNVSHELRTPLTLMLGPTEDLLSGEIGPITQVQREQLAMLHRNELRLLKLVNTLLDFSRIEAGRVQLSYQLTELPRFTAELASSFRAAVERAGIKLIVNTPRMPAGALDAYVDREMWEKIVLNLLSNAFKHTFAGEIEVALEASADGRAALLRVRDTGIGIPADQLPRLFERFHRVPNAKSRTHEGTGIGLALVQELVRMHGGEIEVESIEGVGSTFTVHIPLGSSHLDPSRIDAERTQAHTHGGTEVYTAEANRWIAAQRGAAVETPNDVYDGISEAGIGADAEYGVDHGVDHGDDAPSDETRILFVDDNADMRDYVARLLRGRGWSVEVAVDGLDALDAISAATSGAQAREFDVVLSDVMMPRLDGFGLLHAIRENPSTRRIPVILLSARAGEEARVEGLDAGADDYLVKPFSARELIARVGAHLTLARVRERAIAEVEAARVALESANEQLQDQASELELQAEELAVATEELIGRTEDAERQRALVESTEARLRSIFAQAPVAIAVLHGPEHRYEIANEPYVRLVGGRDIVGLPIREALPELAGQGIYELLDGVFESGKPFIGTEVRTVLDRSGTGMLEEAFFNFVYHPLFDENRSVEGVAVVAMDVTDLVSSRRVAESARNEAEAANRAKSDFLAAMSHELRTPLNAIGGYAELLALEIHGPITQTQRDALQRITRSEQHLLSLINDVLNFAKLEAGRVEYDISEIPLAGVVADVAPMIEPQLQTNSLAYAVRIEPDVRVFADREKVRQILLNLLSNAVKFTQAGGQVVIDSAYGEGELSNRVLLRVSDTGVGIPLDKQEAIFDPFVQVHRNLTQSTAGTGLGLAISRDLARGMGGDLSVQSEEGKGSTFTLTLRRARQRV
jgi:signal transduction histidine kinase/DNA-binding response OmpR family regulator